MADIASLKEQLGKAEQAAAVAQAEYDALKAAANSNNFAKDSSGQIIDSAAFLAARKAASDFLVNNLQPAQAAVSDTELKISNAQSTEPAPGNATESAGEVAVDAGAPVELGLENTNATPSTVADTGLVDAGALDTGTDAPVRTLEQTQGISNNLTAEDIVAQQNAAFEYNTTEGSQQTAMLAEQDSDFGESAEVIVSPGVGANREDSGAPTLSSTNKAIDINANGPITPRPNVLDQYSSYTYSLSWYLLTPDQFNQTVYGKPNVKSWTLLTQSGGASPEIASAGAGGRSPYFKTDYYVDNLILESAYPGGGSGTLMAHNVTKLEFNAYEPVGLTLPNALGEAVKDLYSKTNAGSKASYNLATFAMVIHFYGYDDAGNLVTAGAQPGITGSSTAVIEKIYPFLISGLSFRLATKGIEYRITGAIVAYQLQGSSKRGVVPEHFELVGTTVKDILNGNGKGASTVTVADGRTTKPTPPEYLKTPIKPGIGMPGVAATGNINQDQADTLSLLAAGQMGA